MSAHEDLIILAADTAVVDGKTILGKPKDMSEAVEMLRQLRSRTHQVYTGIAVMRLSDGNLGTDLCVTDVPMRTYSDEEIDTYVATRRPARQGRGLCHPASRIPSGRNDVRLLRQRDGTPALPPDPYPAPFEIAPRTDISAECQSSLNYKCPISAAVLRGEQVG